MISQKILGLDTLFTEWKKSKNQSKTKIAKWHSLASCTSQGELRLGSQIIKFSKYVKLTTKQPVKFAYQLANLNKKANSKMHALGQSVAIVYECGCVLAAHVSIMYTLQICLIRTNLKGIAVFSCLFLYYFVVIFNQGGTKYRPFVLWLICLTPQRSGQSFLRLHKCRKNFQTSKNNYIYLLYLRFYIYKISDS